jgi:ABC-type Fe3+ transport system substrate-binding protein
VIVSSDINSFYHKKFREKFLDTGEFVSLNAGPVNEDFLNVNYLDPQNRFTMLSANLLVIVAVKDLLGITPAPSSWGDLMKEEYANRVAIRGDGQFFCGALLLPFFKLYGIGGVKKLARSVITGMHPAEMVDQINKKKKDAPAMYVMPHFFANKILARERVDIIVPAEGAIISPVQMLVKKSHLESVKGLTDFLCGRELGQVVADAFFPSTNREVCNSMDGINGFYWLGWDFINSNDIGEVKDSVENVFREEFLKSGGIL